MKKWLTFEMSLRKVRTKIEQDCEVNKYETSSSSGCYINKNLVRNVLDSGMAVCLVSE